MAKTPLYERLNHVGESNDGVFYFFYESRTAVWPREFYHRNSKELPVMNKQYGKNTVR